MEHAITLPSKPRAVTEEGFAGLYEIDGLYPGYGHTLGNSLRRIILSSLSGAAITLVKMEGVSHEFSTVEGVKEDMVLILLNLKKVRLKLLTDEPQTIEINVKGPKVITAADIKAPAQVEILNPEQYIAEVTGKNASFQMELRVERGIGYMPREVLQENKVDIGTIALDAVFTPIRRANYEVENMRVGDRTDFNRLRIFVETDGTLSPRDALSRSIEIMIQQLKAVVGFKEESDEADEDAHATPAALEGSKSNNMSDDAESMKTRIDMLTLSARTQNALSTAGIRTVGGLARKREEDILSIEGLGAKGLQEIRRALSNFGITLK